MDKKTKTYRCARHIVRAKKKRQKYIGRANKGEGKRLKL